MDKGLVVKITASGYVLRAGDEKLKAIVRGKLRGQEIYVGDEVMFERGRANTIEAICPRRNVLTRPFVANVDAVLIVVAPVPAPDFVIVDKVVLNAYRVGIKPILVFNKVDLATKEDIDLTKDGYKDIDVVFVSATQGTGLKDLKQLIQGKTVCLAGQSAVGKSSLLNALFSLDVEVGEVSHKWGRGKNTTRFVEMFRLGDSEIVDTCGFSVLELLDIEPDDLKFYYDEFLPLQEECKFRGCNHVSEPDCAVKRAVERGEINRNKYNRYKIIYEELKERRKKQYD